MSARFLGLDLAWSAKNPTGAAVLDEAGRIIDLRADLGDNAEILAWVRSHLGSSGAIGFDMPTVVTNAAGSRECEKLLAKRYRRNHAGPHPSNLGRPLFADGGRARGMIDALRSDGVCESLEIRARDPRILALEVFPHPAHIELFSRSSIFAYKKKQGRAWTEVHAAWREYRAALATLERADPPLAIDETVVPSSVSIRGRAYKEWDDKLDAISCAYVASWVWRWGTDSAHVRVFGDLENGHIVVPARPAFSALVERA